MAQPIDPQALDALEDKAHELFDQQEYQKAINIQVLFLLGPKPLMKL